jgi:hypothetical protein
MTAPTCRFCKTPLTHTFVDLGRQPLSNSYLTPSSSRRAGAAYPLHARVCHSCFLVQVDDVVPADAIFDEAYAYFSSYSTSWVEHARRYAVVMQDRFGLGPESLVIEIASNDGYLLQHFRGDGRAGAGIEPTGQHGAGRRSPGACRRRSASSTWLQAGTWPSGACAPT